MEQICAVPNKMHVRVQRGSGVHGIAQTHSHPLEKNDKRLKTFLIKTHKKRIYISGDLLVVRTGNVC